MVEMLFFLFARTLQKIHNIKAHKKQCTTTIDISQKGIPTQSQGL